MRIAAADTRVAPVFGGGWHRLWRSWACGREAADPMEVLAALPAGPSMGLWVAAKRETGAGVCATGPACDVSVVRKR
jgi:hypothetical protein